MPGSGPTADRGGETTSRIIRHTVAARPILCPELLLYQATPACDLWRATEAEAAALGFIEPYWAFCWAGGQALARYVLDNPDAVAGRNVLDFGAGGAIAGLAAARAGAASVLASDIDPMAIDAILLNAALNRANIDTTTEDLIGKRGPWDIVLVGDVTYDHTLAARVLAWLEDLALRGALVLVGDPGRGYLDLSRLTPVVTYDAPADNDVEGSFYVKTTVWRVGA